jgi:hypothetical protein
MTNTAPGGAPGADRPRALPTDTDVYVLLDRSGSMAAIADDVIGGFNRFLADQRADGDDAHLTLVQFDTQDPQEVVVDDEPIGLVPPLTAATFVPRGGTPLLDATARLIARAEEHAHRRRLAGSALEHVVVVTITDGFENSSTEVTRRQVLDRVQAREREGWTFVYLSADLGAYGEAGGMGYAAGAVQQMPASPAGMAAGLQSVSDSLLRRRSMVRAGAAPAPGEAFFAEKPAEALLDDDA